MFDEIIHPENLFASWREFLRGGKIRKHDVQEFSLNLASNILALHRELKNGTYHHGGYQAFKISDPKPRDIHKASVRDRLVHHAIYRILYPYFDKKFIADSFSCRNRKGTHKAIHRFRSFGYTVSKNNTRTVWVLKCDIRKFFANINHDILKSILTKHIQDNDVLRLLDEIINSFHTPLHLNGAGYSRTAKGLPLGNLTSQLLVNIYMNEFDQFVKHMLKAKHYIRYADDFVFFHENKAILEDYLCRANIYLRDILALEMHPDKVFIKTLASGVDFLGWVHFPDHRVLRTATKWRMLKRIQNDTGNDTKQSYLGLLSHGNARKLEREIFELIEKRW